MRSDTLHTQTIWPYLHGRPDRASGPQGRTDMTDYTIALFLHIVGALGMFVALGIVFLMTTKPDVVGALVVIAVAAAVGAVASRVGTPPRLAERAARAGRP